MPLCIWIWDLVDYLIWLSSLMQEAVLYVPSLLLGLHQRHSALMPILLNLIIPVLKTHVDYW